MVNVEIDFGRVVGEIKPMSQEVKDRRKTKLEEVKKNK